MPTRLYTSASKVGPINSPVASGNWQVTSGAVTRYATTYRTGTTITNQSRPETSATVGGLLVVRFVTPQLTKQTIAGTVAAYFRTSESNTAADFSPRIGVFLINAAGTTLKKTLLPVDTAATLADEPTTSLTNRRFPATNAPNTLTSTNTVGGDRLLIELGVRSFNTVTTSYNSVIAVGDPLTGADAPADLTSTTATLVPWIEFSQNLVFKHPVKMIGPSGAVYLTQFPKVK